MDRGSQWWPLCAGFAAGAGVGLLWHVLSQRSQPPSSGSRPSPSGASVTVVADTAGSPEVLAPSTSRPGARLQQPEGPERQSSSDGSLPSSPVVVPGASGPIELNAADVTLRDAQMQKVIETILAGAGCNAAERACVADHLVTANLMGHDSHGIQMLPAYIQQVKRGYLKPNTHARVIAGEGTSVITIDGRGGFGQVIATEATELAIAAAKANGVGVVGIQQSHHIGRVGAYAEMCAREGLVFVSFASVYGSLVAPFGGTDGRFGTNPFTCAVPQGHDMESDVVLDMATAILANGKLKNLMMKGQHCPEGCVLDSEGKPSRDPSVTWTDPRGCILPFGGHKGSGLVLICELLAAAVPGGGTMPGADPGEDCRPVNNALFIVIDPLRFGVGTESEREERFRREVGAAYKHWTSSPPADPGRPVVGPGDPERITHNLRSISGVVIPGSTWEDVLRAGESVEVTRQDILALLT